MGNEKVFSEVLEITNLLGKYDLEVEKIHCNKKMQITLYMGDVRVSIGEADKLSEKVMKLRDLTPHLKDLSGVLHLEKYSSSADTVIFTKDAEK